MNVLGLCILASVAILVAGAVYVTKMVMEAKAKMAALEASKGNRAAILPLRLQAYERMALFLERIDPNQLVMRIHTGGLTVSQEQNLLLTAIRSEFEHNLSQQILAEGLRRQGRHRGHHQHRGRRHGQGRREPRVRRNRPRRDLPKTRGGVGYSDSEGRYAEVGVLTS